MSVCATIRRQRGGRGTRGRRPIVDHWSERQLDGARRPELCVALPACSVTCLGLQKALVLTRLRSTTVHNVPPAPLELHNPEEGAPGAVARLANCLFLHEAITREWYGLIQWYIKQGLPCNDNLLKSLGQLWSYRSLCTPQHHCHAITVAAAATTARLVQRPAALTSPLVLASLVCIWSLLL